MNHQRKKAAITNYAEAAKDKPSDQLRADLQADEKAYTEEEIDELMTELYPTTATIAQQKPSYEEWRVALDTKDADPSLDKSYNKVKMLRDNVKIPPEMAARLNSASNSTNSRYYKKK